MDYGNQKLLESHNNNSIGEADDRISELPDSVLHSILSSLDTKRVAQTCVLSKRWNHIWNSIPTLAFQFSDFSESKINEFMDFMDTTLHHPSNIQKISLTLYNNMNASRVHSWIQNLTRRNVEDLNLCLHFDEEIPFSIPLSLFTCASLTKLELSVSPHFHLPKNISCPKLKILTLCKVQFTDGCWNEEPFSSCLLLEYLILKDCTWFGMRKFCIFTPSLKVLQIENDLATEDGLQDCELKIYAPSLESLIYSASVAKDYDLSSFVTLDDVVVYFSEFHAGSEQIIGHGAPLSKFFHALAHVRSLAIYTETQVLLVAHHFLNYLPTFHNLYELYLFYPATHKLLFALLKAAPNLKKLLFDKFVLSNMDDPEQVNDEIKDLYRHLQSVRFLKFGGEARELRSAELILKNAESLETMTIGCITRSSNPKTKEEIMSELLSFPRGSGRCVVKFV